MKTFFTMCLMGLIVGSGSIFADTLELEILDGEYWCVGGVWGGVEGCV